MKTARVFSNGRSQAIRLPKEYRFKSKDVFVTKMDNIVMLFPTDNPWIPLVGSLDKFSADFMSDRKQPKTDRRMALK
jgi:antitoxin VapB